MSNIPCSLTRNMTSHSMENLTFHSLLRWKTIILQILATSLIELLSAPWDTVLLFEKVLEKVSQNRPCYTMPCWAKSVSRRSFTKNVSPHLRVATARAQGCVTHRLCSYDKTDVSWGCRGNLKLIPHGSERVNSVKSDQFQFPVQPHQKYYTHSMKSSAFHSLLRWNDYPTNSHYLPYKFPFKRLGECTFWTWEWFGKSTIIIERSQRPSCVPRLL